MKNVLFVVNTEGQLLTASSLIFERFNKTKGFQPYVLQAGKTGTRRFKNEINKALLSDFYFEIDLNDFNIKKELEPILQTDFKRVFIFLEQLSINVYLINYFKKKESTICLGPDGNKPYYRNVKPSIRSRFKETVRTYKYLNERGLRYVKPYFLSWNYGKLSQVDEYWVTFPEKFFFAHNKKVVAYQVMPNEKVIHQISQFFKFEITNCLKSTNDIIFYTNNILYQQDAYDVEIEALKLILTKFPDKPFYLKYHPATPDFQINKFKSLGVICFSNSIPAELYIASLNNSVILGFWSTSLTVENPNCKFYWLHKYLIKKGKMIERIDLTNPTKHIIDIDNLDKINF
jgi:hypothetical protein